MFILNNNHAILSYHFPNPCGGFGEELNQVIRADKKKSRHFAGSVFV